MKNKILKIDKGLNNVHTVLSKLLSKGPRALTKKEMEEIEAAEELLDKLRTELVQLAQTLK